MLEELTPSEAAERLRGEDPPLLLDVRDNWERATASIDGSVHIPMQDVPARLRDLPEDQPIIVHCHHGGRSQQVGMWLEAQGFDDIANMAGGIDEWSQTVDPEVPRYS